MLMLGGFIGFGTGVILGVVQSGSWQDLIWKSAIAAYLGGLLMRWWGNLWVKCIKDSETLKRNAQQAITSTKTQEATAKTGV